jgi:hypothetical protein
MSDGGNDHGYLRVLNEVQHAVFASAGRVLGRQWFDERFPDSVRIFR